MSIFSTCRSDPSYHITLYAEPLSYRDLQNVVAWMGARRVIYITLSKTGLDDNGALCLARALKVHKHIRGVDVSSNNIGDKGARALAEAVASNSNIDYCHIVDNHMSEEAEAAVNHAWVTRQRLDESRKTYNRITTIGKNPVFGIGCGVRTVCGFLMQELSVFIALPLVMPFLCYLLLHPIDEECSLLPPETKTV